MQIGLRRWPLLVAGLAGAALFHTFAAAAQESELPEGVSSASEGQDAAVQNPVSVAQPEAMAEIVVTANKRVQAINDVGLTVSALGGEQLEAAGIGDIADLPKLVTGFSASTSFDGLPVFTIRGVGFNANQLAAAPTVSAYVDEAPLPYSAMTGGTLLDIERVEVLKGPQGTLFGNNSTGGSINFIAAKPTADFSAGFRAGIDRFGELSNEGFVSGPVTPTVRARFAATTTQGGGWQKTYTPGPDIETGDADRGAERLIVEWRPSGEALVSLNLNHYFDESEPQALQFAGAAPSGGPGSGYVDPVYGSLEAYPLPPHDNRAADTSQNPAQPFRKDDRFFQGVLRGELPLNDAIKLTTISNYAKLRTHVNRDVDATRLDIIEGGHYGSIRTFGQELRVNGDFADLGLNVIAGANYSNDRIDEHEPYFFEHFSTLPPGLTFNPFGTFTSKTLAGFANADWALTHKLSLTGGARYTRVRQTYESCNIDAGDGMAAGFVGGLANLFRDAEGLEPTDAYVPGGCATIGPAPEYLPALYDTASTDNSVSWRAGINYKPVDEMLLYTLVSRGYKAGGYPFNTAIVLSQYDKVRQEKVTAYEAGVKYRYRRLLSVNAAGYYYDYRDKQVYALSLVQPLGPVSILSNLPKSKAYGFELESTVAPLGGLSLHAALTYTRSKIIDPGDITLDGFGRPTDLRGHPFPYAPRVSSVFDGEYRMPISASLDVVSGANASYNSKAYGNVDATDAYRLKAYWVVDARLGVESHAGWSATAWIHNLTDTYYWTDINFIGDGYAKTTGTPRVYGATLAYRF